MDNINMKTYIIKYKDSGGFGCGEEIKDIK